MLRALIWDVDGTVAETERDGHRVAFNRAFEAFGVAWHWDVATYGALLHVTGGRERLLYGMEGRADAPTTAEARELRAKGLTRVSPKFHLSTEWGVPFGTVVIGIPFYLARSDLTELEVESGGTGLLISPDRPSELAQALVSLARNPARAEELGLAGRARQRREFSTEAMTRGYAELLADLDRARGAGALRRPLVQVTP